MKSQNLLSSAFSLVMALTIALTGLFNAQFYAEAAAPARYWKPALQAPTFIELKSQNGYRMETTLNGKYYPLPEGQKEIRYPLTQVTSPNFIAVKVFMKPNLVPAPYFNDKTALISLSFTLTANSLNQKQIDLHPYSMSVTTPFKKWNGMDCSEFIKVYSKENTLVVEWLNYKSLSQCLHSGSDSFSYSKLGTRTFSKKESILKVIKVSRQSEEWEKNAGLAYLGYIQKTAGEQILPSTHPATIYLQNRMNEIAAVSDDPRIKPKVFLLNSELVNAYAVPGGYIFFGRALLDRIKDESSLVGIMGHEWAHVTAHHSARRYAKNTISVGGMTLLKYIWIGYRLYSDPHFQINQTTGALFDVFTKTYLLNHSRGAEHEADILGSQHSMAIGFAPWGINSGLAALAQDPKKASSQKDLDWNEILTKGSSSRLEFLNTHPDSLNRFKLVFDVSCFFYPAKTATGAFRESTPEFKAFKESLLTLPAPGPAKM